MAKPVTDHFDPPQAADEIGRFGKYRVLKQLGGGGMGAVFAAEHIHLEQPFALKFMLADAAADPDARRRFLAEARAAVRVKHAHVVAVTDVDELKGVPFIAMEWLRGQSLADYLDENGPPTVKQVLRVGWEAADGLAAAHAAGVVHRDIKPSNLWLAAPSGTVKVIDFGLAADTTRNARHTQTGRFLGTAEFAAPEQINNPKAVDHRADLFSLGVVLYQMLTGERPFWRDAYGPYAMYVIVNAVLNETPPPPAERRPDIPRALSDLVMRLLAKNPADRPASAREVVDELRAIRKALTPPAATRPRPALLVAPFDELAAKEAQAAWARFLGRPLAEAIDLGGVNLKLVLIPPGTFMMGSPETEVGRNPWHRGVDAERQHPVTITKPFYLGKYPVTQAEYRAVMTGVTGVDPDPSQFKGDRLPVENVSHSDAEEFCGRLTLAGREIGLPSEARWEYACRAGTTTPFHFGSVLDGEQACCSAYHPYGTDEAGTEAIQTCEVGRYAANAFGLHDMHGNVCEWCADWYGPSLAVVDAERGQTERQKHEIRVLRGGDWRAPPRFCRSALRGATPPASRDPAYGFRVCICLD